MAKDVVRTRRYINKMTLMRTQIQAVSLKIQVRILVVMVFRLDVSLAVCQFSLYPDPPCRALPCRPTTFRDAHRP